MSGEAPVRLVHGKWTAWAATTRGEVRRENQDAWAIEWDCATLDGARHAIGVFDGVGGAPNGTQAARAAAAGLADAVRGVPEVSVLAALNEVVRATGGATTAVVGLVAASSEAGLGGGVPVELWSVGDSSAYVVSDGDVVPVARQDAGLGHRILDFLGNPNLEGHRQEVVVPQGAMLLLCTDGVDRVVGPDVIRSVLSAEAPDVSGRIQALMDAVHAAGAPDNATVMVLRPPGDA